MELLTEVRVVEPPLEMAGEREERGQRVLDLVGQPRGERAERRELV